MKPKTIAQVKFMSKTSTGNDVEYTASVFYYEGYAKPYAYAMTEKYDHAPNFCKSIKGVIGSIKRNAITGLKEHHIDLINQLKAAA